MEPDDNGASHESRPVVPPASQRAAVTTVGGLHPSLLPADVLLSQSELRTQRRSGPGGQHRNKTSSGVFLHHRPTGVVAEATERRSQADNRVMALARLRYRLALEIRTTSLLDATDLPAEEEELRQRMHGSKLRLSDRNEEKPAVLALLLNDLHAAGGQPSMVARLWGTSTSSLVRIVKSHAPAFVLLNSFREHHRRAPLH